MGHIFLGKENGLTIINGKSSVHLHMDGPVYVGGTDHDTLFYACENDLGYLIRSAQKGFHTVSLKHLFASGLRSFFPGQLIQSEKLCFVNTDRGIYVLGKGKSGHFPYPEAETHLYVMEGTLYLAVENRGIFHWNGDEFEKIVSQQQIGGAPPRLICREDIGLRVLNANGEFYLVPGRTAEPERVGLFPSLEGITLIGCINDQLLLVNSVDHGIGISDHLGRNITWFEHKAGLPEQDIQQIRCTGNHDIWVLAPHSLHKITFPSPIDILEINTGETGTILASVLFESGFALGTTRGLYLAQCDSLNINRWYLKNLSPDVRESIHLLASDNNLLIGAGTETLYFFSEGSIRILDRGSYTGLLLLDDGIVIAGGESGINAYQIQGKSWKKSQIDPSLTSSHSFVQFEGEVFFLCSNGIYKFQEELSSIQTVPFTADDLLYGLKSLEGELYLLGEQAVYLYDRNEEMFLSCAGHPKAVIIAASDLISPAGNGDYWIVRNDSKFRSRIMKITSPEKFPEQQNLYPVLQDLGEVINLNVRDSAVYITGRDKVVLFDLHELGDYNGQDNIRFERIIREDNGDFEIQLAGLNYQSVPEPLYRHRLYPERKNWSTWSTENTIVLKNLDPGQYRFMAQSQDLYGQISDPVELSFTIKPPFYRTWYAYVVYILVLLIGLFLFRKWRLLSYQRAESRISLRMQDKLDNLTVEKEKSDRLMSEFLPEKTAEQLRTKGKARWDKYEKATVLFSDIQGFTRIAEEMNPELLIDELDKFFFHFDSVVDKYNIEKIKTIGDAYMAAGGIPEKNSTNPVEVVLAALEMQSYMQHLKSTKAEIWDLRIGIHTGPVIAGVIGHKKVSYDIWGDTVNTASRMESSGIPGKVNISGITYELVKDYFLCEYRGKLPVKYKGNIDMYFVTGLRPELSVDLKGIPNKRFFIKLQLLRLGDLEDKVFNEILRELPVTLHFHKLEHARRIYEQSFLLCRSEEIGQEERLLVRSAALMLFTGLTQSYTNYENRSSVITREILPDYKYTENQIDQICNLILATKTPFDPFNPLEKILIDAKMEYVGRPDYPTQINLLYKELTEMGRKITWPQFKQEQVEFLSRFNFFTLAAQRLREIPAEEQLDSLKKLDG
ncbi:MAG: adenylate/guanylate cyclase domain-containing protein [Bacteroidales bacterium]